MNREVMRSAALVVGGVCVGSGVTYIITKERFKKKYRDMAEEEIKSVKETYMLLRKEGPYSDPRSALKAYNERLDELQYYSENGLPDESDEVKEHELSIKSPSEEKSGDDVPEMIADHVEETKVVTTNIFDEADAKKDEWDVKPDPNNPYIIQIAEFMENDDYDKITITYFEEDDTLCDEGESVISDVNGTIGGHKNLKFGKGSDDNHIVYIRNEKRKADFEVVREEGSYAKIVHGIDLDEPKPRIKKMRDDD